jgi:glutamine amidotransferase
MTVAVINIGVGNTASVIFALERLGADVLLTSKAAEIEEAERAILPGVGAAGYAMSRIKDAGLGDTLTTFGRPLLGVCLGQQILFDESEEGGAPCLGVIKGKVKRLEGAADRPIPHMGWSAITPTRESALLEGVKAGDYVYFVHSFACPVTGACVATANYGADFAAVVSSRNFYGCQFHPERSGEVGRRIFSNFLGLEC